MRKEPIQLLGFAPDLDPAKPGVIRDGVNFVPTLDGFKPLRAPDDVGISALPDECRGAVSAKLTDDSARVFAGTQTELYEASGGMWSVVSSATYTGGAESRWRFAQFGNNTFATNLVDAMQYTASGNFADVGDDAPKALIVEACGPAFVMAFNYNDGVNIYEDGWWCSALNNSLEWTPSIATQSANGRLTQSPGPIRAGKRLGLDVVAYKERSMYLGRYVGPPFIWAWQLIPGEIGAPSQESVVNIDTAHLFPGFENFYYFDGSRPVPIGNPLKEWYNDNVTITYKYRMQTLHDRANSNAYFFYPDTDGVIMAALVYNYRADKWGKASLYEGRSLEAVLEYVAAGVTYDGIGSLYATYDALPAIPYDSPFWTASTPLPGIFQDDHVLYSLTGIPENTRNAETIIQGNYSGNENNYSTLTRLRAKFIRDSKDSATLTLKTSDYIGATETNHGPYSMNGNKVDLQRSAKFHSPMLTFRGDYEITGYELEFEDDGMD